MYLGLTVPKLYGIVICLNLCIDTLGMWQPELLSDMVHSDITSGVAAGHMISQSDKQLLVNWNNK